MRFIQGVVFLLVLATVAIGGVSARNLRMEQKVGSANSNSNSKFQVAGTPPNLAQEATNTFFSIVLSSLTNGVNSYPSIVGSNSIVQFTTLGTTIDLTNFNDSVGFVNPAENLLQANLFAQLVNNNHMGVSNIEATYWDIIASATATQDTNPANEYSYQEAWNYLYQNVSSTNPFTNVTTYTIQNSPIYQEYQTNELAYATALTNYRTAQQTLTSIQWYEASPGLGAALTIAYDNWRSVAPIVEDALSALSSLGQSLSATAVAQAKQLFLDTGIAPPAGGSPLSDTPEGPTFHPVYPVPDDWAINPKQYTTINISSTNYQTATSTGYTSWAAAGGFPGLISVSASANGGSSSFTQTVTSTAISINLQLAIVELQRPWLLDNLFSIGGWSFSDQPAGSVSNGNAASPKGMLSTYPTHVLIAQNLNITANWSEADYAFIESHVSASASVGFGPFTIAGGSYSYSHTSTSVGLQTEGSSILTPGAQVIGYIQAVVPYSPQLPGPS